jgi:hypothetical protein
LDVRWKGLSLPYTVFDKEQRASHAAIVENKRLGEALAFIKAQQDRRPPRLKTNSERIGYLKRTGKQRGRPCGADLVTAKRAAASSGQAPGKCVVAEASRPLPGILDDRREAARSPA